MVWSPSHRLQTVKNAAYPAGATSKASASGVVYMVASTASLKRLEDLQHGRVMWQHGKSVYMCLFFCCRCRGSFFVLSLRFEATKNAPGSATTEAKKTPPQRQQQKNAPQQRQQKQAGNKPPQRQRTNSDSKTTNTLTLGRRFFFFFLLPLREPGFTHSLASWVCATTN